jgi:UDP-4-amino-4,6-dideoxy-N-acetyl-beta-L-altrosamine transaminase
MRWIPYGRQDIDEADIAAVVSVLRSDMVTQGPAVESFESAVAAYCGARHAVAVNSGTSALHIACAAAGLGPGDLLWTVPNSFVASANCARYCGADVDFVDIDPATLNMSVEALERKLAQAARAGRLPKVLVPVHFAGLPCDMEAVARLARPHGIIIVEDASHALGARYRGEAIGSCRFSDMVVLSFHPVKLIATGEGGMVLTQSAELLARLAALRSHGLERAPQRLERKDAGGWYYEQSALGFNYRLSDIHAALGENQMRRLQPFLERRREIAARYREAFAGLPLGLQTLPAGCESAWHLFVVQFDLEAIGRSRREIYDELRGLGIGVQVHYIPIHTQPYYRKLGFKSGDFPAAERYYERALSLPIFYRLASEEQDYVIASVRSALSGRSGLASVRA